MEQACTARPALAQPLRVVPAAPAAPAPYNGLIPLMRGRLDGAQTRLRIPVLPSPGTLTMTPGSSPQLFSSVQLSSVQSLSRVRLFATP